MDEQNKDLRHEPGSVQRQTQRNEQYETEKADEEKEFGIISKPQVKGRDRIKEETEKGDNEPGLDLEEVDDEKIIPGLPREHRS